MGQVTFKPTFSGGNGDLIITSTTSNQTLQFDQDHDAAQSMALAAGNQIISISGGSDDTTGADISLKISGDVPSTTTQDFGKGFIPPHSSIIFVTA